MGAVMERRDGEDDGREIGESYQREAIDMGAVMERRDGEDDGREIGERATRGRQ